MSTPKPKTTYTIAEAARELGLSRRTVQSRVERGEIQAERIGERLWTLSAAEVERLRAIGKRKPGPKTRNRRDGADEGGTAS